MRARWIIAAAGALGAARLLLRPRPDAGKVAALDDSARVPYDQFSMFREEFHSLDSVVDTVPPELFESMRSAHYNFEPIWRGEGGVLDIGLGGTGLEVGLREDIAGVIRAGRALEPAAIWNRICTEYGLEPGTAPARSLLYWQEITRVARSGQLDGEWADIYDIPTADPLEPR